jgi:hypothetical protein
VLSSCLCFGIHEWETLLLLNRVPVYFQNGATVKCVHEISLFSCTASQETIWFVSHYRVSSCHFVADKQMILTWKVAVSSMFSGSLEPWYLSASDYRWRKRPPEKQRRKRLTYLLSSRGRTKGLGCALGCCVEVTNFKTQKAACYERLHGFSDLDSFLPWIALFTKYY